MMTLPASAWANKLPPWMSSGTGYVPPLPLLEASTKQRRAMPLRNPLRNRVGSIAEYSISNVPHVTCLTREADHTQGHVMMDGSGNRFELHGHLLDDISGLELG